jgi:hypothetical protein
VGWAVPLTQLIVMDWAVPLTHLIAVGWAMPLKHSTLAVGWLMILMHSTLAVGWSMILTHSTLAVGLSMIAGDWWIWQCPSTFSTCLMMTRVMTMSLLNLHAHFYIKLIFYHHIVE